MKKFKFISFWALLTLGMATAVFISCSKDDNSGENTTDPVHQDNGVVINGIKWATRNVASPGTFAANPEDLGMFFQWNRKKEWSSIGNVVGWDSTMVVGSIWGKDTDPSPTGWRPPTSVEIQALVDIAKVSNEWITENGIKGRRFTDKVSGNSMFLPAAGFLNYTDGVLYGAALVGYYWSRTGVGSEGAFGLILASDTTGLVGLYRPCGFSLRCVSE